MVICKICKKQKEVYVYRYLGQKYCFHSLSDTVMSECQKEEDEKGFWKSTVLHRYSFQTGFNEGLLIGTKLASLKEEITLKKELNTTPKETNEN